MEKYFISNDDKQKIVYHESFVKNPIGVIQILHGSSEYIGRYKDIIKFFNDHHFSVIMMDIRGHGETGKLNNYGIFADKNGSKYVLNDVHKLNNIIKKKYPNKKIILLGHSLGSFIARAYITKYNDIDILIALGSNHKSKFLIKFGTITSLLAIISGKRMKPGKFFHMLSYKKYNNTFKNEDKDAWLSRNIANRKIFRKSPYPKFIISYQGFHDIFDWMNTFTSRHCCKNINKNLPILLLNGKDDPVNSCGKDIYKANNFYKSLNCNSKHIEYPHMRHELLNELKNSKVYKDILNFININL